MLLPAERAKLPMQLHSAVSGPLFEAQNQPVLLTSPRDRVFGWLRFESFFLPSRQSLFLPGAIFPRLQPQPRHSAPTSLQQIVRCRHSHASTGRSLDARSNIAHRTPFANPSGSVDAPRPFPRLGLRLCSPTWSDAATLGMQSRLTLGSPSQTSPPPTPEDQPEVSSTFPQFHHLCDVPAPLPSLLPPPFMMSLQIFAFEKPFTLEIGRAV